MNQDDNNFEQVTKLLKLKRHEVPPPGYFNNFSSQVISRIRAGEAARSQSWGERLQDEAGWLGRFLQIFETRPGLVGGFATSLCLLLLLTVVFAERSDMTSNGLMTISGPAAPLENSLASAPVTATTTPIIASAEPSGGIVASTNAVISLQPATTLFGQPASAGLFQTASFGPAGQ